MLIAVGVERGTLDFFFYSRVCDLYLMCNLYLKVKGLEVTSILIRRRETLWKQKIYLLTSSGKLTTYIEGGLKSVIFHTRQDSFYFAHLKPDYIVKCQLSITKQFVLSS